MAEEFLNPDGNRKRQQLIEHILRLLSSFDDEVVESDESPTPRFAADPSRSTVGNTRSLDGTGYELRPVSTHDVRLTRARSDERGISFAYCEVTWIGIQVEV
ncbi:MAG: hypothetical protein AAF488_02570 [Planctomycetota bacterium]